MKFPLSKLTTHKKFVIDEPGTAGTLITERVPLVSELKLEERSLKQLFISHKENCPVSCCDCNRR